MLRITPLLKLGPVLKKRFNLPRSLNEINASLQELTVRNQKCDNADDDVDAAAETWCFLCVDRALQVTQKNHPSVKVLWTNPFLNLTCIKNYNGVWPFCKVWMKLMQNCKSYRPETKSVTMRKTNRKTTTPTSTDTWPLCVKHASQVTQKQHIVVSLNLHCIKLLCHVITEQQVAQVLTELFGWKLSPTYWFMYIYRYIHC